MISKVNGLLGIGYSKLVNHLKPKASSRFHTKMTELLQKNATVVKLNEGKDPTAAHLLSIKEIRKAEPLKWPTATEIGIPADNDPLKDSLPGTSNSGIRRNPGEGDGDAESKTAQIRQTSEPPGLTIEDIRNSEPLRWPTAEEINTPIDDDSPKESLPGSSNSEIGRNPEEGDRDAESEVAQIRQTSEQPPLTIEDIRNAEPLKWPTAEEINAPIDDDPVEE